MTPRRLGLGAVAAIAVAALVSGMLVPAEPPTPAERPGASAVDRGPDGLHAWRTLLDTTGREVELIEVSPRSAVLDSDVTAVLLDAGEVGPDDARALREFVERGGRLVIGGTVASAALSDIAGVSGERSTAAGAPRMAPLVPAPEVDGVAAVEGASGAGYLEPGPALPLLGAPGQPPAVLRRTLGDGRVLLVADSSPLTNGFLASADNARLALTLPGPARPVAFLERVRAGDASGLAALPAAWAWTAGGLAMAALVLIASRARRLGPPDQLARELPPPRRLYVEAIAASLERSGDRAAVEDRLRASGIIVRNDQETERMEVRS